MAHKACVACHFALHIGGSPLSNLKRLPDDIAGAGAAAPDIQSGQNLYAMDETPLQLEDRNLLD